MPCVEQAAGSLQHLSTGADRVETAAHEKNAVAHGVLAALP